MPMDTNTGTPEDDTSTMILAPNAVRTSMWLEILGVESPAAPTPRVFRTHTEVSFHVSTWVSFPEGPGVHYMMVAV